MSETGVPHHLRDRWARYAEVLEGANADAFVLTSLAAVKHSTDIGIYTQKLIPQRPVAIVLTPGDVPAVVCVRFEHAQIASENPWIETISFHEFDDDPWAHVVSVLRRRGATRVIVEETMPVDWFSALSARGSGLSVDVSHRLPVTPRIVKDEDEVALIQRSSLAAERALAAGAAVVVPGSTEADVAQRIAEVLVGELGTDVEELAASCNAPENNRKMHHRSSAAILPRTGLVRLGVLVRVEGYWTLITRMLALDGSEPEVDLYKRYIERYQTTMQLLVAGSSTSELYDLHRRAIVSDGFELTTLKIGHGTGLDFRELPWLSPADDHELEPGTMLAYDYDLAADGYIMHVEDRVLISPSGPPQRISNLWRLDDITTGFEPALSRSTPGVT